MKSLYLAALALLLAIPSTTAVALLAEQVEVAPGETVELGLDVDECAFPEPPVIPDGRIAPESELAAAGAAMRSYQTEVQASLDCIDELIDSLGADITSEQDSALTALYNNGVEQLTVLAKSFNDQVHAFRARQAEQAEKSE